MSCCGYFVANPHSRRGKYSRWSRFMEHVNLITDTPKYSLISDMTQSHSSTNTRKAIVIGVTSGIGKEVALLLAQQGWKVGVAGRRVRLRITTADRTTNVDSPDIPNRGSQMMDWRGVCWVKSDNLQRGYDWVEKDPYLSTTRPISQHNKTHILTASRPISCDAKTHI